MRQLSHSSSFLPLSRVISATTTKLSLLHPPLRPISLPQKPSYGFVSKRHWFHHCCFGCGDCSSRELSAQYRSGKVKKSESNALRTLQWSN
ncbi:hypothetical protein F2Q68_00043772 [Brassica cretica]|uniref:Uncharacterized protein n=1 Tax=Brassica cretica TaxID=69181 RepID=A0A8S9LIE6_BRACR|nr:hypothetical protein F2Q68_00043772 [Brassica cretica]